jgi:hypothetical protein
MAKIKNRNPSSYHTKPRHLNRRAFEKVYWPYIPVLIAVSVLLAIGSGSGNLQAYIRHPGGSVLSYATNMSLGGLLADTNSARASSGVTSLSLNNRLNSAAQSKADDMAARDYWSHNTPEGNPPWTFVKAQGYSYQKLGENLATGFNDEQSTIDGWMASPPHRENLLDSSFKEVGFGFANIPNYTAAGGGPMTIVVAFYGNPQVLASSTGGSSPAPAQPKPVAQPVPPPAASAEAAPEPTTAEPVVSKSPAKQPVTSDNPKPDSTPQVKTSRIQSAIPVSYSSKLTGVFIITALALFLFWANRHIRAIHRFLVKGERYAVRHPITDIGILVIAALLFILSQSAGIIR